METMTKEELRTLFDGVDNTQKAEVEKIQEVYA